MGVDTHSPALLVTLELAVPMWIEQMRPTNGRLSEHERHRIVEIIGSKGDTLQFKTKKEGRPAEVFNALARGLAALAYAPGGVTFAGHHWCTDHQVCIDSERYAAAQMLLDGGKVERLTTTAVL